MLRVQITIQNLELKQKDLKVLRVGLVKLSPAMKIIGKTLAVYYGGVAFQSKGGVFGERWAPLSEVTKDEKAKSWRGRPDMVRTGQMRNSFDYTFNDTSATIGNTDPKFKYHQSSASRKKLPRRVMIGVNKSVNNMVNTVVSDHINKIVREF
jgi:hypothetical protein